MVEVAALTLATAITERMHLCHINFLSDNQELVQFINTTDHSNPPDWRIKPITQLFLNYTQQRSTRTFKIKRCLNETADTRARQALRDLESFTPPSSCTCPNSDHYHLCTLSDALQSVTIDSIMVLTARCCSNKNLFVVKKMI
jgi:hypothetical protein